MPEMEARPPAENRHGGAPRGERPASWDAPRLTRADQSRLANATNEIVRLSALRPPLFGSGANGSRPPGRRNASRERDVLRGTRPRSGLFDIVKKDGARAMPRAAFAFARGSLTHIWKPRIAAQAPVSLGWTGGGRPGAKPVRTQSRFRSRYLLGRMVSSKACKFRDHAPAGTTAMINAESNEKRRTPCHAAARSCASNRQSPGHAGLWTRRATL